MTKLIEVALADEHGSVILINPAHISTCTPCFRKDDDGIWTHTNILMVTDGSLRVNMSLEQIKEALDKVAT